MILNRLTHIPVIALMLSLIGGGAWAQSGIDYGRPIESRETRADMALRFSARCVVSHVPSRARKVIDTAIASEVEAKRVKSLIGVSRKCFPSQWPSFPPTALRNAIAETLYRDTYRTKAPMLGAVLATPPASFAVSTAAKAATPEQDAAWYLAALSNCAVFAGSEPAREFIMGPANVPEETRRFDRLRPALRQCVAVGGDALLTPRLMRGYIAQALFAQAEEANRRL